MHICHVCGKLSNKSENLFYIRKRGDNNASFAFQGNAFNSKHHWFIISIVTARIHVSNVNSVAKFCQVRRFSNFLIKFSILAHKMLLKHLVKQHNQVVDRELVPLHKCDICNYKTIYKSDLTKHKRKHTGEKPYRCPICFKEFSDSSILRRHEVVHTGEKPWKCYLCDKAYTLRSTLTNHFKKAHSTWPNPIPACPICKREFENREGEYFVDVAKI